MIKNHSTEPPCHMGDIVMRVNSLKVFMAKYLILTDPLKSTTVSRSPHIWPEGNPLAFHYKVFVIWSSDFVMIQEPIGTTMQVWFHADEIRVCQTLSEENGIDWPYYHVIPAG